MAGRSERGEADTGQRYAFSLTAIDPDALLLPVKFAAEADQRIGAHDQPAEADAPSLYDAAPTAGYMT